MSIRYQLNTILSNGTTINSGVIDIPTPTIATSTNAGLVMPVNKTDAMTQEVGVDSSGKLYTTPGGGGSTVEVVQDLGTSTTAVISQSGINTLLRGDNALLGDIRLVSSKTTNTVLIGTNAHDYNTGSSNCIAIGTNTECGREGGVAIGANTHIYSSSFNCISIGKNVTIGDSVMNTIALGHDFMVTGVYAGGKNDRLIIQNTPVFDFVTGKILPDVIPPVAMSSIRAVCSNDSQYMTTSYLSPTPLTNGSTTIQDLSRSIKNIGAVGIDTMVPAYGQHNGKQVVGIYSTGITLSIRIVFQDGNDEKMSELSTINVTSTTPSYASTQSAPMRASRKAVDISPNSSTYS